MKISIGHVLVYVVHSERQKCSQQLNNYTQYQLGVNKFLENQSSPNNLVDINDLIHLEGPITEDSLIRALQSRFMANECFVSELNVLLNYYKK